MIPAATIAHHLGGRTRFRIPGRRGDHGYFASLIEQMRQCPGVLSVTTNAVTGSVLILHEAPDPDVLIAYARTLELFEVQKGTSSAMDRVRPPATILTHRIDRMDRWIHTETQQATDLRSVVLTGLVGAALWQALRGPLLPAAATLAWYALTVASGGGPIRSTRHVVEPSAETAEALDEQTD